MVYIVLHMLKTEPSVRRYSTLRVGNWHFTIIIAKGKQTQIEGKKFKHKNFHVQSVVFNSLFFYYFSFPLQMAV